MKSLLSVLLGLMLFTSLIGISYAAPTVQPTDDSNPCIQPPNMNNPNPLDCRSAHSGNDPDPLAGHCIIEGQKTPDTGCRCDTSRTDAPACCPDSILPNSLEVSDVQTECF